MKKVMLTGLMGTMLAVPAFATDTSTVTTKNYVDDGLRAVYKASKTYTNTALGTLPTDVANLKTTVNGDGTAANPGLNKIVNGDGTNLGLNEIVKGNGTTTTGLVGDIAALQQTVGDATTAGTLAYKVNQLESSSTVYTAGNGINIDTANDNTISVKAGEGLAVDSTTKNITIDGLATTKASGNTDKMYVYKNGALTEMPVVDTWDTDFDFEPENP
jgi:hypothetical protein